MKKVKTLLGVAFIVGSLTLLRIFQLTAVSLVWLLIMPVAVLLFALGVKWGLEEVAMLRPHSGLWPVFAVAMAVAWLIHAGQFEDLVVNTWFGAAYGVVTAHATVFLLNLSGINATLQDQILFLPQPSKVSGVAITPLCGGILSFIMFTVAFGIVLFDVGHALGRAKLLMILLFGAFVTFAVSILRIYLVVVLGFYYGIDIMMTAHTYLGYVLFLTFVTGFWYIALLWSKRPLPATRVA